MFDQTYVSRHHRTSRRVEISPLGESQPIAGIRAAENLAKAGAQGGLAYGQQYAQEGEDIGSMLVPELEKEAMHPQGYGPEELNNMNVAGQQALGGATASLAGEAGLRAARTRNNAATAGTLDELARSRMRAQSQNALDISGQNAELKQRQRQAALSGLAGQRGLDVKSSIEEQGLVPEDIKAWTDASKSGWLQNTLGTISTLAGSASSLKNAGFPI